MRVDLVQGGEVDVQFLNVKYDECFGACCLPDGQCVQVKPEVCTAQNGVFYGLGLALRRDHLRAAGRVLRSGHGRLHVRSRDELPARGGSGSRI